MYQLLRGQKITKALVPSAGLATYASATNAFGVIVGKLPVGADSSVGWVVKSSVSISRYNDNDFSELE